MNKLKKKKKKLRKKKCPHKNCNLKTQKNTCMRILLGGKDNVPGLGKIHIYKKSDVITAVFGLF